MQITTRSCYRMSGPISRSEAKVPWASRTDSPTSSRSSLSNLILSPAEQRFAENSPLPVSPESGLTRPVGPRRDRNSAPAELHQLHAKFSLSPPEPTTSLDQRRFAPALESEGFRLDANAPTRALRHPPASPSSIIGDSRSNELILEPRLESLLEEDERQEQDLQGNKGGEKEKGEDDGSWGKPFKIEWMNTERLPFFRTRHLRNPWNHDREIKVSRDGTELEPNVGQALLDEWNRPDPPSASPTPSRTPGSSKRETKNLTSQPSQKGKKEKEGHEG
jgi:YT521-B-like domain